MHLLLDVSNLVHRSFHGLPPLTAPDGTPTNAVFGFCKTINGLQEKFPGANLVAALDPARGQPSWRRRLWPAYKANREESPEALLRQWPLVHEALAGYGIPVVQVFDMEADDVLASLAETLRGRGEEVVIVSGDKDLLQLVTDDGLVTVLDPASWTRFYPETVRVKMAIEPRQVVDYLALVGDSSDNYPGCPGIGKKRAVNLLANYGSLEGALMQAASIRGANGRYLTQGAESARLCKQLATLRRDLQAPGLQLDPPPAADGALDALFARLNIRDLTPPSWPS